MIKEKLLFRFAGKYLLSNNQLYEDEFLISFGVKL